MLSCLQVVGVNFSSALVEWLKVIGRFINEILDMDCGPDKKRSIFVSFWATLYRMLVPNVWGPKSSWGKVTRRLHPLTIYQQLTFLFMDMNDSAVPSEHSLIADVLTVSRPDLPLLAQYVDQGLWNDTLSGCSSVCLSVRSTWPIRPLQQRAAGLLL